MDIDVKNLTKRYGDKVALDNISFSHKGKGQYRKYKESN